MPVSSRWVSAWKDPCSLLDSEAASQASGLQLEREPVANEQGRCRYQVADQPVEAVSVDLLGTQDTVSWANRNLGTTSVPGGSSHVLQLDVPGAGLLVRGPSTAALVRVQSSTLDARAATAAVTLIGRQVETKLPVSGPGTLAPGQRDPCGAVAPKALGEPATSGDPSAPGECAYNLADGTRVEFGLHPKAAEDQDASGEAVRCAGQPARWFGNSVAGGTGGSGHLVSLEGPSSIAVTMSSSVRSATVLRDLALRVCGALRKAI